MKKNNKTFEKLFYNNKFVQLLNYKKLENHDSLFGYLNLIHDHH